MNRHFGDPCCDTRNIKKRIWDGGKNQDRPAAIFIYPGFNAVIHVGPLHDRLTAKACKIARQFPIAPPVPAASPTPSGLKIAPIP